MYFIYCNPGAALGINLRQFPGLVGTMDWEAGMRTMIGRIAMTFGITPEKTEILFNPPLKMDEERWKLAMQAAIDAEVIQAELPLDQDFTNDTRNSVLT
jgi:hypothetical protein